MTKKEQQAEEQELAKAVSALKAALRGMAQRKATRYEADFLLKVRDMIDREIETNEYVKEHYANHIGKEVADQIKIAPSSEAVSMREKASITPGR